MPKLRDVLKTIFSLSPTAAGAERNWSIQDFIFSKRRNRLDGERGTRLVYVYWNLRALEARKRSDKADLSKWRADLQTTPRNFPHPTDTWTPFSNWSSSALGNFDGMHGDDRVDVIDDSDDEYDVEQDDVDETPALDWSKAGTARLRPCPSGDAAAVTGALRPGDKIVVWFGAPYFAWYEGKITRLDRRCALPVTALFDDGEAEIALDPGLYGVTGGREWAILEASQPTPIVVDQ